MSDPTTTNRTTALRIPSPESFDNLAQNMRTAWARVRDAAKVAAEAIEQSHNKTHTD